MEWSFFIIYYYKVLLITIINQSLEVNNYYYDIEPLDNLVDNFEGLTCRRLFFAVVSLSSFLIFSFCNFYPNFVYDSINAGEKAKLVFILYRSYLLSVESKNLKEFTTLLSSFNDGS